MVWYSHLFKNFPQFVVIHTVKGFSLVNEAEVDVFLEFFCFFVWSNRCWQFDLWFLCLFYVSLNIWKFLVHVLLKPSLKNFEHYFARMWNECNWVVVYNPQTCRETAAVFSGFFCCCCYKQNFWQHPCPHVSLHTQVKTSLVSISRKEVAGIRFSGGNSYLLHGTPISPLSHQHLLLLYSPFPTFLFVKWQLLFNLHFLDILQG